MVLIYLGGSECVEIPEAAAVVVRGSHLAILDGRGNQIRQFPRTRVQAFTSDPDTVAAWRAEFWLEPT